MEFVTCLSANIIAAFFFLNFFFLSIFLFPHLLAGWVMLDVRESNLWELEFLSLNVVQIPCVIFV